jgi:hypothetical protein
LSDRGHEFVGVGCYVRSHDGRQQPGEFAVLASVDEQEADPILQPLVNRPRLEFLGG